MYAHKHPPKRRNIDPSTHACTRIPHDDDTQQQATAVVVAVYTKRTRRPRRRRQTHTHTRTHRQQIDSIQLRRVRVVSDAVQVEWVSVRVLDGFDDRRRRRQTRGDKCPTLAHCESLQNQHSLTHTHTNFAVLLRSTVLTAVRWRRRKRARVGPHHGRPGRRGRKSQRARKLLCVSVFTVARLRR